MRSREFPVHPRLTECSRQAVIKTVGTLRLARLRCLALIGVATFATLVTAPAGYASDLPHADQQLARIVEDRPKLAAALESRPAVRDWIHQRFRVTEPLLSWDSGPTVSGRMAECDVRDPEHSFVRVTKDASGIDQLTFLLFELHNIQGYPVFDEVHEMAVRGEIGREAYADRMLRQEFAALLQFRAFCREHLNELTSEEREEARVVWRLVYGTDSYEEHLRESRERGRDLLDHWRFMYDTAVIPEMTPE